MKRGHLSHNLLAIIAYHLIFLAVQRSQTP